MQNTRLNFIILLVLFLVIGSHPVLGQDQSQAVQGGGIFAEGWMGQVDPGEAANGQTVDGAKLMMMDDMIHVTTGPSISYWKEGNTASGNYTVSATFTEPKFMNLSGHPHPYGLFIGGNNLGTDGASLLYCATYGNGAFIVRGFGPEPFQMNGRRAEQNDAIHKAAGNGESVTQEVAISVMGDKVECSVNGTVVGSYAKSDVVGEGKLKSTDGVYGIRVGHNVEAMASGLKMTSH